MYYYWPRRNHLTYSGEHATVTYDPPERYGGGLIRIGVLGPSSCIWIVPGTLLDAEPVAATRRPGSAWLSLNVTDADLKGH